MSLTLNEEQVWFFLRVLVNDLLHIHGTVYIIINNMTTYISTIDVWSARFPQCPSPTSRELHVLRNTHMVDITVIEEQETGETQI